MKSPKEKEELEKKEEMKEILVREEEKIQPEVPLLKEKIAEMKTEEKNRLEESTLTMETEEDLNQTQEETIIIIEIEIMIEMIEETIIPEGKEILKEHQDNLDLQDKELLNPQERLKKNSQN